MNTANGNVSYFLKNNEYLFLSLFFFFFQIEKFKYDQNPINALHTVFNIVTGDPVYKDDEYGHLQVSDTCN